MGLQKYVSDITNINWNNSLVYNRLSNFESLKFIFNKENFDKAKSQLGDQADKIKIENFSASADRCSFDIPPVGNISLEIIDREEPKMIKIASESSSPMQFTLWIQLLPVDQFNTKMRLTLHVELNMMMKMMVGKKLKEGINQFANGIAMMPFGAIPDPNEIGLN
jgi:hypothetical protein